MKEYKCIKIGKTEIDTSHILNLYAQEGWELVTQYYNGYYLVLVREKQ